MAEAYIYFPPLSMPFSRRCRQCDGCMPGLIPCKRAGPQQMRPKLVIDASKRCSSCPFPGSSFYNATCFVIKVCIELEGFKANFPHALWGKVQIWGQNLYRPSAKIGPLRVRVCDASKNRILYGETHIGVDRSDQTDYCFAPAFSRRFAIA